MSIFRCNRYIKTKNGLQKTSEWQKAQDVECNDGKDLETKLSSIVSTLGNCTFNVQSDGAYVTYKPTGGADSVTKKLGNGTLKAVTLPYTATDDTVAVGICQIMTSGKGSSIVVYAYVDLKDTTSNKTLLTATTYGYGNVVYHAQATSTIINIEKGHTYTKVERGDSATLSTLIGNSICVLYILEY